MKTTPEQAARDRYDDNMAAYIDGAIRLLYNSSAPKFVEIFGEEDGMYLWDKFTIDKKSNEGDFICCLDHKNQRKLARAVHMYIHKEGLTR